MLAEAKALEVSPREPGALVIGADQVMECGGVLFTSRRRWRPRAAAPGLRGKTHSLNAGIVRGEGRRGSIWRHSTVASDDAAFSDGSSSGIARAKAGVLRSVGAYRIEGPGIQLFSRSRAISSP